MLAIVYEADDTVNAITSLEDAIDIVSTHPGWYWAYYDGDDN